MRGIVTGLFAAVFALPLAAQDAASIEFDVRARENLLFGVGQDSGEQYYDVPITNQPQDGVLIKLPYTQKGGTLTFDIHQRVNVGDATALPAELLTVVDVLTGGTNRLGSYTLLHVVDGGARFEEEIDRVSDADIDRYVIPFARRSVTINTQPGPQSISVVGRELSITREGVRTRVNTPGVRVAMVSNIHFEEARIGEELTFGDSN